MVGRGGRGGRGGEGEGCEGVGGGEGKRDRQAELRRGRWRDGWVEGRRHQDKDR